MEAITGFLEDFDFAKLLPEIGKFMSSLRFWMNFIMLLGPVVLLIFGVCYYFRPVEEPSEKLGFRVRCAMGSTEAWLFAQKQAGTVWMYLGGAMTVVSVVLLLLLLGAEAMTLALVAVIWMSLQAILAVASYFFLRSKVSAHYDKEGKPKKKR